MIISRSYAKRLVREGKATLDGASFDSDGKRWQIVDRHDMQRVDHYELRDGQLADWRFEQRASFKHHA